MKETRVHSIQANRYNVVLDLDRTLFDTPRFMDDVVDVLGAEFNIATAQFRNDMSKHYTHTGPHLRTYDLFEHVGDLALNPDAVEQRLLSKLSTKAVEASGYLYPDVPEFVNFLRTTNDVDTIQILTYGKERTQNIKLTLARLVLGDIYGTVTQEPKDSYLRIHCADQSGIIIDDKQIENLPTNFAHLLIDRSGETDHSYASLADIQDNWDHAIDELTLAS